MSSDAGPRFPPGEQRPGCCAACPSDRIRPVLLKIMFRKATLFAFATVAGSLALVACGERESTRVARPNIILIMADDLGYHGLSSYGDPGYQTLNIDRLAEEGLRFTDFYANAPVCTPTRAALLTGRYQQRSGLEGVIYVRGETRQTGMAREEVTIAEVLKDAGYRTGIMGKWHLGYKEEYNPVHQGFDQFYGFVSGNIDYHSHYDNAGIYDWWHNTDSLYEEGYSTDLITEHALDFIEESQDRPFFLYVAHETPHVPFQSRSDSAYRFPGRDFSYYGPVEDTTATFAAMMRAMDEGVGEIIGKVEELGLQEETLIIFCSDNGGEPSFGRNGPLRGHKTTLWEGGIRVPMIAWWPGQIRAGVTGQTAMSFDFFPTFLQLVGQEETDTLLTPDTLLIDGTDLSPLLLNGESLPERDLYWRYRGQKTARRGPWKLMVTEADTMLFNLEYDLAEQWDSSAHYPERLSGLLSAMNRWEQEVMGDVTLKTD